MSSSVEPEPKRRSACLINVIVGVGVILFLCMLLVPAVQSARETARRMSCTGNLKMIGLSLHNYAYTSKVLPPAYFTDREGHPMHSWRMLLLRYMEADALCERYRFTEPWDSPANRAIADGLPMGMGGIYPIYHCLSESESDKLDTSYVTIVGAKAFSPGPTSRTWNDIADGTSNTIWLAEMAKSGIHWMEPRDLQFDEMSFQINDDAHPSIRSVHSGVANVSMLDGSVRALSDDTDPKLVKGSLTIAGGDPGLPWD